MLSRKQKRVAKVYAYPVHPLDSGDLKIFEAWNSHIHSSLLGSEINLLCTCVVRAGT